DHRGKNGLAIFRRVVGQQQDRGLGAVDRQLFRPLDGSTSLFVKFKGPAALADTLREPFTAFVRSIRWK
ncbi:MAG: hypothetical protein ACKOWG_08790, partial [Planctomycetia bacterium]